MHLRKKRGEKNETDTGHLISEPSFFDMFAVFFEAKFKHLTSIKKFRLNHCDFENVCFEIQNRFCNDVWCGVLLLFLTVFVNLIEY